MMLISLVAVRFLIAAQQDVEQLLVRDPRPMAGAVDMIERRCHCIVTYEDIRWRSDQVEDLPGAIGPIAPKIPAGRPFMFSVGREIASQGSEGVARSLNDALDAYERTNEAGAFRIGFEAPMFHVYPLMGAPLGAAVSLKPAMRSLNDTIIAVMAAASESSHAQIRLGTAPTNFMLQARIALDATNEPARRVLARAVMLTGRKLSWRLLYDFSFDAYYLNIHAVP